MLLKSHILCSLQPLNKSFLTNTIRLEMRNDFKVFALVSVGLTALIGWFWQPFLWAFVVIGPLVLLGFYDMAQTKHAIMRTFPLFGRGRYWMEWLRPKI